MPELWENDDATINFRYKVKPIIHLPNGIRYNSNLIK